MPTGAVTSSTLASSAIGGTDETTFVSPPASLANTLVNGPNVLAVEVHQSAVTSSDISFNLELIGVAAPACYALTLSHTGQGSDPVATPANSTGCSAGQYVSGEAIALSGAVPTSGWQISSWTGTSNDSSTASTNSVTMPASVHTAAVNYIQSSTAGWTAYNDVVYEVSQYTQPNVTYFDIGSGHTHASSGTLVNFATGNSTGVVATLTEQGGVTWITGSNGGSDTASGTDAYQTFQGITDIQGVTHYATAAGWYVDLTFTGLDPSKAYTFATTVNRNLGSSYENRHTPFTLSGVDQATNASTVGANIIATLAVEFSAGDNYNTGYVARWTGIRPGTDGSFTIRAQAHGAVNETYGFSVFMLKEETVPPPDVLCTDTRSHRAGL